MTEIQKYINRIVKPIDEIVLELRKIILTFDLEESIKWNFLCYSNNGLVCSLPYTKQHVRLEFFNGYKLKDNYLQGSGKKLRHLKFYTKEEINKSKVKKLIKEAIKLNFPSK
tara:strand:- start:58 stop:393 length:336 start_codon:yes stop_codon:yes gene_type:complete